MDVAVYVVFMLCITSQVCESEILPELAISTKDKPREEMTPEKAINPYVPGEGMSVDQITESLKKYSEYLEVRKNVVEARFKEAKRELISILYLKKSIDGLLMRVPPDNETMSGDDVFTDLKEKKYVVLRSTNLVNWVAANTLCKDMGMELATFESRADKRMLEEAVQSTGVIKNLPSPSNSHSYAWLGASNKGNAGLDLVWSRSGRPLPQWAGITTSGDNECLQISWVPSLQPSAGLRSVIKWATYGCADSLAYYVCEDSMSQ